MGASSSRVSRRGSGDDQARPPRRLSRRNQGVGDQAHLRRDRGGHRAAAAHGAARDDLVGNVVQRPDWARPLLRLVAGGVRRRPARPRRRHGDVPAGKSSPLALIVASATCPPSPPRRPLFFPHYMASQPPPPKTRPTPKGALFLP